MAYSNVLNITYADLTDYDDGTSPAEVYSLTFYVPLCSLILWSASNVFQASFRTIQVIEACILNLSLLVALTLLNEHLELFCMVLLLIFLAMLYMGLHHPFSFQKLKPVMIDQESEIIALKDLNSVFVGGYRGHLLLATCICILAVDFNFFPSRFAKTETYGWSIMDAGVGSFILLHGLCSSHGKYLNAKQHGLKKCLLSSLPLFILGFIRLYATNAVGYHKVVPEYGIHWNFFFTLAFTKLLCYSFLDTFPGAHLGILAVTTAIIHQMLLSKAGLIEVVLSEARTTFFEANKEGICSLLGFVSLYFCGVQLGRLVWKKGLKIIDYVYLLLRLCGIGAVGWMLMYVFQESVQPVSRRMANLPYCIWVVTLTSLQLALHLFQELIIIVFGKTFKMKLYDCMLWKAINYNGLGYFLLANLLTGLVNITIKTSKSSDLTSLLIMMLYLTTLTIFSVTCYKKSILLKFW